MFICFKVYDLPNVMSKFLHLGMPLLEVIKVNDNKNDATIPFIYWYKDYITNFLIEFMKGGDSKTFRSH